MTSKDIAQKLVEAVKATPEVAQELIADPSGAVARVAGATDGFDLTKVVQEALALAADLRLDLSCVDLGKLDLSQIDVAKLDLVRLASVASACNVDMSKLDMGAVTAKLLGGGLFGRREERTWVLIDAHPSRFCWDGEKNGRPALLAAPYFSAT